MRWEQASRFKEHKSQSGETVLNKEKGLPGAKSPAPQPPRKSVPPILGSDIIILISNSNFYKGHSNLNCGVVTNSP